METVHYLIHGTWVGIIAFILLLIGLTLISFSQISLHKHTSPSGSDGRYSHLVIGAGFIVAAILIVLISWFFGEQATPSKGYEHLLAETCEVPEVRPYFRAYLLTHPALTKMDYDEMERDFETLKQRMLIRELEMGQQTNQNCYSMPFREDTTV